MPQTVQYPQRKKVDLVFAPVGEGALILALAAIGWVLRAPLVFASLGPTAYELVEKPQAKSARTYNIIVGHYVGLAAGFFSLWLLRAFAAPKVMAAGFVAAPRMWAAVVAVVITTLVTLALKAGQPASLSTTLLVSLGGMQTARGGVSIAIAVLIIAAIGEPVRRLRMKAMAQGALEPAADSSARPAA